MDHGKTSERTSGFSTYVFVWIVLVVLALISIVVSASEGTGIVIVLAIATVKAGLILYYFMHLRHEGIFFKLAFLLPIAVLAFSIGFTFLDVLYR